MQTLDLFEKPIPWLFSFEYKSLMNKIFSPKFLDGFLYVMSNWSEKHLVLYLSLFRNRYVSKLARQIYKYHWLLWDSIFMQKWSIIYLCIYSLIIHEFETRTIKFALKLSGSNSTTNHNITTLQPIRTQHFLHFFPNFLLDSWLS